MKISLIIFLIMALIGCTSINANLSTPPSKHDIIRPTTDKELIYEWQKSAIKIKEWQAWFNIQIGSNYYTNEIKNNTNEE